MAHQYGGWGGLTCKWAWVSTNTPPPPQPVGRGERALGPVPVVGASGSVCGRGGGAGGIGGYLYPKGVALFLRSTAEWAFVWATWTWALGGVGWWGGGGSATPHGHSHSQVPPCDSHPGYSRVTQGGLGGFGRGPQGGHPCHTRHKAHAPRTGVGGGGHDGTRRTELGKGQAEGCDVPPWGK